MIEYINMTHTTEPLKLVGKVNQLIYFCLTRRQRMREESLKERKKEIQIGGVGQLQRGGFLRPIGLRERHSVKDYKLDLPAQCVK